MLAELVLVSRATCLSPLAWRLGRCIKPWRGICDRPDTGHCGSSVRSLRYVQAAARSVACPVTATLAACMARLDALARCHIRQPKSCTRLAACPTGASRTHARPSLTAPKGWIIILRTYAAARWQRPAPRARVASVQSGRHDEPIRQEGFTLQVTGGGSRSGRRRRRRTARTSGAPAIGIRGQRRQAPGRQIAVRCTRQASFQVLVQAQPRLEGGHRPADPGRRRLGARSARCCRRPARRRSSTPASSPCAPRSRATSRRRPASTSARTSPPATRCCASSTGAPSAAASTISPA